MVFIFILHVFFYSAFMFSPRKTDGRIRRRKNSNRSWVIGSWLKLIISSDQIILFIIHTVTLEGVNQHFIYSNQWNVHVCGDEKITCNLNWKGSLTIGFPNNLSCIPQQYKSRLRAHINSNNIWQEYRIAISSLP